MKTFYSFKVKFSRVRLDKRTQWQDFKKSMLKKPKLLIFKVSDYYNDFSVKIKIAQLQIKLYNQQNFQSFFTRLSTKNFFTKETFPKRPKWYSLHDEWASQALGREF